MAFLYVKAYHGPCTTHHRTVHKPQLLYGLRDSLQKLGYRVDLVPVEFVDYCMLEICGHEVFRCNIKNLKFNTETNRDPVSKKAVEAVIESSVKFRRARAFLWFWTLLDHQLFRRSPHAPKDFWAVDVDIKKPIKCVDCVNCCDILLKQREREGGHG